MEERLISFEIAKLANEKGFNWKTHAFYNNLVNQLDDSDRLMANWNDGETATISAPTQSLLQKWLRDVHGLDIVIHPEYYIN